MRIPWLSSYLDRSVAKGRPKHEIIAMRFAKDPEAITVSYLNVSDPESKDLELLRAGKFGDQSIQDRYNHNMQGSLEQLRDEAVRNIRYLLICWLLVIGFVVFLFLAHHDCSTPGHLQYYINAC